MSNIYKDKSFVAKNERVQIPDITFEPQNSILKNTEASGEEPLDDIEIVENDGDCEITDEDSVEEASPRKGKASNNTAAVLSKNDLYELYKKDLEDLAKSVAEQAYYDALNKKKAELRDNIAKVKKLMDELAKRQNEYMQQYTDELKYMAIDIAEKIMLEKIQEDDMILERLVLQSVKSVKNAEWINLELSERLISLVDFMKNELEKPEYHGRAFVFPIAGTDDICRVTTDDGTIVSTIGVQTENLRKAFKETDQQDAANKGEWR
ncbi:MAG: hypothetical protein RR743_03345 [Oscillospiraceae bacterium]